MSRHRTAAMAFAGTMTCLSACGGLVDTPPGATGGDAPPNAGVSAPAGASTATPPVQQPSVPLPKPPNPVQRCAFAEGPWLINDPAGGADVEAFARTVGASLFVYVRQDKRFDRFTVASSLPCVLARDPGFTPSFPRAGFDTLAVDDLGTVWSSRFEKLQRAAPLPVLSCASDPGYLDTDGSDLYDIGGMLLDEDGKGGWGIGGPDGKVGRLTLGTDACSVTLVDAPWGAVPVRANTPRDSQGRFHVIDAPTAGGIGIYTSSGALVSTYSGKSATSDPAPYDATRCAGGVCVLTGPDAAGQQSIVYLDDDGKPRSASVPLFNGLRTTHIAAARSGAIFVAGSTDPTREAFHEVVIQMAPAPP